jgi:hypothetical protein
MIRMLVRFAGKYSQSPSIDHLDKTKDLAKIGAHGAAAGALAASRKKSVFDAGCRGCRWSGILDRHEPGLHHPNKGCQETQSDGAYFEHDRPRGRTITLVGNRKVSPIGHLDRPHLSAWRGDGAPPLLSRRVGRPARRTKALAGTRGNTPKLAAHHFLREEIGSPCMKTACQIQTKQLSTA